jgi:hypothetical protein
MSSTSSRFNWIAGLGLAGCAILSCMLVGASSASASPSLSASSETPSDALGGWIENAGAFAVSHAEASKSAARATVNHRGKAELKTIGGTTNKRAHGWTTWAGTKHYTTAQLEKTWPSSGVITSSGRKWGTGGTEAVSAYRAFNPNQTSDGYGQARTYYGR